MKVLIIVPSLRKTGVTEVIKNLVIQSKKSGKVCYSLLALKDEDSYNKRSFFNYVEKIFILKGNKNISTLKIRELNKIIKKVNPDIVHLHGFVSELYIPFIRNRKVITTAHNMGEGDFRFTYGPILGALISILQLVLYKKLDVIVGVSKSVSKHYTSKKIKRVYTIENGVCVPSTTPKEMNCFTRPIGIYVGNVDKRKNVEALLDNFHRINKKQNIGTLIIVGDNPKDKSFFDKVRYKYDFNEIYFTGRVSNVFEYLSAADYFISASKNEGLPMAAIEAMGENLYLILSDIPQHRELKKNNNQNIVFFKNDKEMKNAILSYTNNADNLINSTNYKIFSEYFNSKIMFSKYLALYKKIINDY